jgi:hypothetical protein
MMAMVTRMRYYLSRQQPTALANTPSRRSFGKPVIPLWSPITASGICQVSAQ